MTVFFFSFLHLNTVAQLHALLQLFQMRIPVVQLFQHRLLSNNYKNDPRSKRVLAREGPSLMVQWLRFHIPKAVGTGSIHGQGTKTPNIVDGLA